MVQGPGKMADASKFPIQVRLIFAGKPKMYVV